MSQSNEATTEQVASTPVAAETATPESSSAPVIAATLVQSPLSVTDVLKVVMEQNRQLTGAYQEMNTKLTAFINAHNSKVTSPEPTTKTPKAAKIARPSYVVVLRRGANAVRVVERKSRTGVKGSAPTGRTAWSSETKARAFWRNLPGVSEYRQRLEEEGWRLSFELYDSKKHSQLPTQFRGKNAVAA